MNFINFDRMRVFAVAAKPPSGPVSSLGNMPTRNGLLIELTTPEGVVGWGEVWCNFPPRGSIAKLNLLVDVIAPELINTNFNSWTDIRPYLEKHFERMIIHTGEYGPFKHCFAAIDTAAADIAARIAGKPLARFLAADSSENVKVYASTPDVRNMAEAIPALCESGHKAVKLKIGFDESADIELLKRFREVAPHDMTLMVDANQNWSAAEAKSVIDGIKEFDVAFVEEPLLASDPLSDWTSLAQSSNISLAAGENICSASSFKEFVSLKAIGVIQPDVTKWGGVSGAMEVGRHAISNNAACAIHYMGSALGLAASLHVRAAIGEDGPVELDANINPLRTDLGDISVTPNQGRLKLPRGNGLGFVPDMSALKLYQVGSAEVT
ncbi:MAG: mandelate racemase/muconate lactonizing enzyme family protein [Cocleimonas sp.]